MNSTGTNNIIMSDDYVITTGDLKIEATESLGVTMFKHMKKHKDNVAQIDAQTGEKDTYNDLLRRSVRTALHMADKNITRDHIVTLCTHNHMNCVVPYIATQFLGARIASIDPSFSPQEMTHLLKQVQPKILFVIPKSAATIEKILQDISLDSEIVVFGTSTKHTEFSHFVRPHEKEEEFQPVEVENLKDTAAVYFSSGTTGLPKGICINHYSFVNQLVNAMHTENPDYDYMMQQAQRVSFPLTTLGYTSLYWISAGAMLLTSILSGYCRLVCPNFDAKEVWNLIHKYKPVLLTLTAIQAMEMLDEGRPRDVDVKSILSVIVIGSGIPTEYALKMKEQLPDADLSRGYGQTEVCGPLALFRANDRLHRPLMQKPEKIDSVGLPVAGVSYKVVDIDTEKNLGPHQRGELRIKSKFIMNGYFNADSSESFDEDGWLKTGDIVYYDEDYCFYVVDRIKEAFKYQGWFIAPLVLENELLKHPAVKLAVVIGVPKHDGYHPMGLVVVREGFDVSEEEIEKFVEERVPERQRLRAGVKFIKSVPMTVTGKVKRREIRQMVLEGRCE
ncbi:hypothetical protein GEV33_003856 [Tenebrio molitor]|uniref:Luciferase n=1 Tax=Tenebrio molitor TaxID=7067 RepID=A0A8J6HHN2_TENMO|nr:hypothetical protein GEV33_003856 [Tenebrio molitor]